MAMSHLGAFVPSKYFAFIYIRVYNARGMRSPRLLPHFWILVCMCEYTLKIRSSQAALSSRVQVSRSQSRPASRASREEIFGLRIHDMIKRFLMISAFCVGFSFGQAPWPWPRLPLDAKNAVNIAKAKARL